MENLFFKKGAFMCFSSSASFTASAVLSLIGIISINRVKKKTEYLFAAIPFLFGIQQFCEGMVWRMLTLNQNATFASISFLFFAFMVWPLWIPLALIYIEPDKTRKLYMIPSLICGALVATTVAYSWQYESPIALIQQCHIVYIIPGSFVSWIWATLCYLWATIIPCYISSRKGMAWLGTALALSYIASYVFYYEYLISVWCFFTALLSILIITLI